MATVAPDSEYVFIWIHTGVIGLTVFIISTIIMVFGACRIVFFVLKSPSLRGIGAGFCCAMISQQLGGYGNQVLMQFPNCLIFYGGLAIVYVLPYLEKDGVSGVKGYIKVNSVDGKSELIKLDKGMKYMESLI